MLLGRNFFLRGDPGRFAEDIPDEALLFAALQDSAWEQRVAAIKAIGRRQAKTLAEPLMEALKDEYAAVRSIAVKVLGELAVPVAIESLVCALQDPSWEVRAESAYALGKMGHRIPVVPLLQALYDHDVSVRAAALKALGQAGAQARVEHIVQVFLTDTSWEVRAVAALALGELKAKSQLKTLLAQMENEEDLVRQAIKVACEQICAPIDDTALRAALREQTLSNATASSTPAQPDNVEKNSPAPQPASPAPEKTQIYAPIGDTVSLTVLRNQTHPTAITSSIPAQSENAEKNPLAPLLASPVTEKTRKLPHLIHLSSDRHLGSYILGEKIGQGGVCSVFLARHQFTGQTFALKISEEKDVSKFFQREAQVLMQLNHPHIIRIYDANIEEGIAYLAMDYLPNGTLRKKCPQGSHLPAYEVMTYIKELTSALQYAHNHQIIHGDVKPENVLFGPKEEVVLCDFGIASHSHSSQSLSKIMGTPSYMAPEQFDGRLLEASDQYALALIAWELLSGKHASHTFSYLALTAEDFQKATAEALRQSLFFSTAEQVLCKALSKDPDQRFENVTAFMMALEAALQAEKGSVEKVLTGYGYSAPPASLYSVTPGLRGTSPDGVATLVKMP